MGGMGVVLALLDLISVIDMTGRLRSGAGRKEVPWPLGEAVMHGLGV